MVNGYHLLDNLGGGLAEVWRATDDMTAGSSVVLKIYPEAIAGLSREQTDEFIAQEVDVRRGLPDRVRVPRLIGVEPFQCDRADLTSRAGYPFFKTIVFQHVGGKDLEKRL